MGTPTLHVERNEAFRGTDVLVRPSVEKTSGGDGLGGPSDLSGWPARSLFRKKRIVGGGWRQSQSVSHTRAFGNDLCGNAPSRVVSLPDHRTDHSSRDGIPELLVFRHPEKTEIPTQPPSLFPLISPFALPSIRAEMIHPRESKGARMRKAVEVRFTEERLHSAIPISVRRLSDADF